MSASINQLPPELLTDILQLAIQNDAFERTDKIMARTLILCSICSLWRSLVISDPSFWSRIPLGNSQHSRHLTQLCLERSRVKPIDIVARTRGKYSDGIWQCQQELTMHISRIRSVTVSADSREDIRSLLTCVLSNQVPDSLKSLSIKAHGSDTSHTTLKSTLNLLGWFGHTEAYPDPIEENLIKLYDQLHVLRLNQVSISVLNGKKWKGNTFGQLRKLVLSSNFAEYCGLESCILDTARNLQLLEFHGSDGEWVVDSTTLQPVLGPTQGSRTLRAHKLSFNEFQGAVDWITRMPDRWEIEMFIVLGIFPQGWASSNSLRAGIKALSLDNSKNRPHFLHFIMQSHPNLHTLTLERYKLDESFLSDLTRPHDVVEGDFPRISVLRLHLSQVLDSEAFKSMIASHAIQRLELWDSALRWDEKVISYRHVESSPLYHWLGRHVPETYIRTSGGGSMIIPHFDV